ncbi:MAG: hypothetical protein KGL35_18620, partial [Bradyrhizobium sp.]|nr:hypothetical protein [Bradyrhizobium sp.]
AVTWLTGAQGYFSGLSGNPLLENRLVSLTKLTTTTFSLTDALTGASINGASLAALGSGVTFNRALVISTPYIGTSWQQIVSAQSDQAAFLLHPSIAPYAVTVETAPTNSAFATFNFAQATFLDGPYLDPPTNGVQVTPNATSGIVELTLSFQAWSPFVSYADGDFVSSGGLNYESQEDQNIGSPIACTFTNSSASISATNSFTAGQQVAFFPAPVALGSSPGTLPSNLTAGTVYYVISSGLSSSAFEVSATSGGSAISMSGAGSGTLNVALAPAALSSAWSAVSPQVAINGGDGFQQTDVGRLIRLFSEPALWSSTASYSTGAVVSYNPSGLPGQTTYWQALENTTNNAPGSDISHWEVLAQGGTASPALWSWGKITSLLNFVPNAPSGIAHVGNMTGGGGLGAAFNGTTDQDAAASASVATSVGYVGQNFSGCSTSSYQISSATIFPSSDDGFFTLSFEPGSSYGGSIGATVFAYLYGSNSAPSSATNGTLLGQAVVGTETLTLPVNVSGSMHIGVAPVTIATSNSSSWAYLWVVIDAAITQYYGVFDFVDYSTTIAQVEFVNASGSASSGNGVNV